MPDAPRKENQSMEKEKTAPNNIQDLFLNHVRKERILVTIFLMGGAKLSGKIKSFDKYALVLEANNQEQLIFKHAVSSVVVSRSTPTVSPAVQVAEA